MDFTEDPDHRLIREAVREICARFPDEYWMQHDWTTSSRGTSTRRWRRRLARHVHPGEVRRRRCGRPGSGVAARGGHGQRRSANAGTTARSPCSAWSRSSSTAAKSSASASCARGRGQPAGVLRRHRAGRRHGYHQHHHVRREGARRLPGQRPEDLHLAGRAGRAPAADHSHRAPFEAARSDRRDDAVLPGDGSRSGSSRYRSSAATRSVHEVLLSTTCSSPTRTASARKAAASSTCWPG